MRCPNCNAENQPNAKFCVECGSAFQTACAKCGFNNPPGAKFCQECGASFKPGSASQSDLATGSSAVRQPAVTQTQSPEPGQVHEGECNTVTALFADIKGSTELMADLDPEEAREIIDPVLRRKIDSVHREPVAWSDFPERARGTFRAFRSRACEDPSPPIRRASKPDAIGRNFCWMRGARDGDNTAVHVLT